MPVDPIPAQPQRLAAATAGVLLLAVLVHAPSLRFGFTGLDDRRLILDSQEWLRQPDAWLRAFQEDVFHRGERGFFFRPLLSLSFVVDARLGGAKPAAYHATNLILHLCGVALFLFLSREIGLDRGWMALAGAWFAVHPALVQAVAWIPGRNDTLLGVFALASFLGWLRLSRGGGLAAWGLHLGAFAAALLAKESASILPLLCLLHGALFAPERLRARRTAALVLGWGAIGLLWLVLRRGALAGAALAFAVPSQEALEARSAALLAYLGKAVVPARPSVYATLDDLRLWPGWIALGLVSWRLALARGEALRRALFGLVWFALFLVPVLAKPERSGELELLDHRLYVALFGLAWLLPAKVGSLARLARAGRLAAAAVVALFALGSLLHARHFRDEHAFWKRATEQAPNSAFVWNHYGALAYREGRYHEAERAWLEALELDPLEPLVHGNLGLIYLQRGDLQRAAAHFYRETQVAPGNPAGYFWLGVVRWREGNQEGALELWWRTLETDPRYQQAYDRLARAYAQRGDVQALQLLAQRAQRAGLRLRTPATSREPQEPQPTLP